jgi:uncharacterized protein (TIGR03663 family)
MPTGMARRPALRERLATDRALQAVLAITLLGLLARGVALGARVAHQDEARVAFWTLRYAQSGVFEYRPIIHGPFLPIVDSWVIRLIGPSDVATRGVVAAIGGALPLTALLFRGRLRDPETVALSFLFAANPVLLYYSRFYRSDMIVVTFAIAALGLFVRAHDHGDPRYLYLGAASLAAAMSAKENALLYPVCWLGALALLFDHRLFLARARGSTPLAAAKETFWDDVVGLWHWRWPVGKAVVAFLAVFVFFYAPRGGGYGGYISDHGLGLWMSLELLVFELNPTMFLAVLEEATLGTVDTFMNSRWSEPHRNDYLTFFAHFATTLREGAAVVVGFSVVGFLADRYSEGGARPLIALSFYWGAVSVFGYPMATDIRAAWVATHAIAPLAIPAAVGLGMVWRWGSEAVVEEDEVGVVIAGLLFVLIGWQIGLSVYGPVYAAPQSRDNQLVQYAQSSSPDMKDVLNGPVREAGEENAGVDVLFYGAEFNSTDESAADSPAERGGGWFARLPLAWYFEIQQDRLGDDGFTVASTTDAAAFERTDRARYPPVVIALANASYHRNEQTEADIAEYLEGYRRYQFQRYQYSSAFVVYVRADWEEYADVPSGLNRSEPATGPGGIELPAEPTNTSTGPGPEREDRGGADPTGVLAWAVPATAVAARRRGA